MEKRNKKWLPILAGALALTIGVIALILIVTKPMPIALLDSYELSTLWAEGKTMNECVECHNSADFHTCETCHDDHGAVEIESVRFFEVVQLTGDVPDPTFVRVNAAMPDQKNAGTHIKLEDFLAQNGVDDFLSVTFTTNDGGLATVESTYLDETAMLVPYVDGVRFITESVHSSTWLKGINRIMIVSQETPLTIDGVATSIGRLLVGTTVNLTVEGSDTMLTNDAGEVTHALVANRIEGVLLAPLLDNPSPKTLIVTNASGETTEWTSEEVEGAVIAIVRDKVTLILVDRGRSAWPTDIVKIESK